MSFIIDWTWEGGLSLHGQVCASLIWPRNSENLVLQLCPALFNSCWFVCPQCTTQCPEDILEGCSHPVQDSGLISTQHGHESPHSVPGAPAALAARKRWWPWELAQQHCDQCCSIGKYTCHVIYCVDICFWESNARCQMWHPGDPVSDFIFWSNRRHSHHHLNHQWGQ